MFLGVSVGISQTAENGLEIKQTGPCDRVDFVTYFLCLPPSRIKTTMCRDQFIRSGMKEGTVILGDIGLFSHSGPSEQFGKSESTCREIQSYISSISFCSDLINDVNY